MNKLKTISKCYSFRFELYNEEFIVDKLNEIINSLNELIIQENERNGIEEEPSDNV